MRVPCQNRVKFLACSGIHRGLSVESRSSLIVSEIPTRALGVLDSLKTNLFIRLRTRKRIQLAGVLSEGQYEIIPYLRVSQPEVPAELLNNLIEDIDSFGLDYLNVPFLRTPGVLSVMQGGGGEGGN